MSYHSIFSKRCTRRALAHPRQTHHTHAPHATARVPPHAQPTSTRTSHTPTQRTLGPAPSPTYLELDRGNRGPRGAAGVGAEGAPPVSGARPAVTPYRQYFVSLQTTKTTFKVVHGTGSIIDWYCMDAMRSVTALGLYYWDCTVAKRTKIATVHRA